MPRRLNQTSVMLLGALVAVLLLALTAPVAGAASASAPVPVSTAILPLPVPSRSDYDCHPATSNAATPPPVPAGSAAYAAVAAQAKPLCPPGEVPSQHVVDLAAAQKAPPPMYGAFGAWYGYAISTNTISASANTQGFGATLQLEDPALYWSRGDHHSIAQLWALDTTPGSTYSDVELGWTVDSGLNGDLDPHLFSFTFDTSIPGCYNRLCPFGGPGGFVQTSTTLYPGFGFPSPAWGYSAPYLIQHIGSNWWIGYYGQWIGYYPPSAWPHHEPSVLTRIDTGGEVAVANSTGSCTDMGNGIWPTDPVHSANIYQVQRVDGAGHWYSVPRNLWASDPSQWTAIAYAPQYDATGFNYGGGGFC